MKHPIHINSKGNIIKVHYLTDIQKTQIGSYYQTSPYEAFIQFEYECKKSNKDGLCYWKY